MENRGLIPLSLSHLQTSFVKDVTRSIPFRIDHIEWGSQTNATTKNPAVTSGLLELGSIADGRERR